MAEKNLVEFIEEWQTGMLLFFGSLAVAIVLMSILSSAGPVYGILLGFFGGGVLAFLTFSYVLYGR